MSLWTHRMFSVVSSRLKMQDVGGPTTWLTSHCIIHLLDSTGTFLYMQPGFWAENVTPADCMPLIGQAVTSLHESWVIRLTASQESNPPMMAPRCPPLLSCCDHSHIEVELSYNGKWSKPSPVECSWAEWVLVEKKSALPLTRNIWLQNTHLSRMIALE